MIVGALWRGGVRSGWTRRDVVEADEIDVVAFAVFGDFKQVEHAEESGLAREFRSDVGESDGFNGVDFDFALFHAIAGADADAGLSPYSDAHGDFAAPHSFAEAPGKYHADNLLLICLIRSLRDGGLHGQEGKAGI